MENLEQPKQEEVLGSKESFGKFKDAESLLKAYNNLEAEFTKKSQKLATLTQEVERTQEDNQRRAELEQQVNDYVEKYEMLKPFKSALKDNLMSGERSIEQAALELVTSHYKRPEEYAADTDFLENFIYSNDDIKSKIVRDYMSRVAQSTPIKLDLNSNIALTPPRTPSTIQEAGRLAKTIIKQK